MFSYYQRSRISSKFLIIAGKVFVSRPIDRKKSWTHPTAEGVLQLKGTAQKAAKAQEIFFLAGPYLNTGWHHPESTSSCNVVSTEANNLPALPKPATPLHQFRLCPNSSPAWVYDTTLCRNSSWRAATYGMFGKDDIMWEGPRAATGKEKKPWSKVRDKELGPDWSIHFRLAHIAQRKKKVDR